MGATSEEFINLREKEYLISATFKVEGHLVNTVENYLLETSKLVNYKILPDTDDLYKNDKVFKKLVCEVCGNYCVRFVETGLVVVYW